MKYHEAIGDILRRYKTNSETDCWLWTGAIAGTTGYGSVRINGKNYGVHRLFYTELVGLIPKGKQVLHHCDVPHCVNPRHLYTGTQKDNLRDAAARGRMQRGEARPQALINEEMAYAIRALWEEGKNIRRKGKDTPYSERRIAEYFKVSLGVVHGIAYCNNWSWLPIK